MHLKRKKGFILLETLIILNILIILISLYAKENFINLRKSKYYTIKEDIMTLTIEEEELIKEVEKNISLNMDIITKLKGNGVDEKIQLTSSKDKDLLIEIFEKDIYLIHKNGLDKKYRKLEYNIGNEGMKIKLRPTRYVTPYTNK